MVKSIHNTIDDKEYMHNLPLDNKISRSVEERASAKRVNRGMLCYALYFPNMISLLQVTSTVKPQ